MFALLCVPLAVSGLVSGEDLEKRFRSEFPTAMGESWDVYSNAHISMKTTINLPPGDHRYESDTTLKRSSGKTWYCVRWLQRDCVPVDPEANTQWQICDGASAFFLQKSEADRAPLLTSVRRVNSPGFDLRLRPDVAPLFEVAGILVLDSEYSPQLADVLEKAAFRIQSIAAVDRAGEPLVRIAWKWQGARNHANLSGIYWLRPEAKWATVEMELTDGTAWRTKRKFTYRGEHMGVPLLASADYVVHGKDTQSGKYFDSFTRYEVNVLDCAPIPDSVFTPEPVIADYVSAKYPASWIWRLRWFTGLGLLSISIAIWLRRRSIASNLRAAPV